MFYTWSARRAGVVAWVSRASPGDEQPWRPGTALRLDADAATSSVIYHCAIVVPVDETETINNNTQINGLIDFDWHWKKVVVSYTEGIEKEERNWGRLDT